MKRFLKGTILCLIGFLIIAIARYAYIKTEYPKLLAKIEHKRSTFARKYQSAQSEKEKERIVLQTREYLHDVLH